MILPNNLIYSKIYILNFLERFSTIGLKSFLILYLLKIPDFDNQSAVYILSIFFFWEYIFSIIIGKYIDKYFTDRKAIALGFFMIIIASFFLISKEKNIIFLSITFFNISAGLIKPSIPNFLKNIIHFFKTNKYDQKFLIVHIFTNTAAILGPLLLGYFLQKSNIYLIASILGSFGVIGFIISISILKFSLFKNAKKNIFFLFFCISFFMMIYISFLNKDLFLIFSISIVIAIFFKIFNYYNKSCASIKKNLKHIFFILILFFVYFLINMQKLSTLSIIIENFVNRSVMGFEIPTPWLLSLTSIFIILFSYFKSQSSSNSSTIKNIFFGAKLELILYIFLAFFIFYLNTLPLIIIILFYIGFSFSEIHISPTTISYIAQKTPNNQSNFYFGLAPFCAALASYLNIILSEYLFFKNQNLLFNFGIFLLISSIVVFSTTYIAKEKIIE